MTSKDEALNMAIEAMTLPNNLSFLMAITACKEALKQPKQKVKVLYEKDGIQTCEILPASSWQGLSDNQIIEISNTCDLNHVLGLIDFGRAIEQALKEKNG